MRANEIIKRIKLYEYQLQTIELLMGHSKSKSVKRLHVKTICILGKLYNQLMGNE